MLRHGKVWLVLAFSLLAAGACSSDEGKRTAHDDAAAGEGGGGLGEGGTGLGGDGSGLGGVGTGLGGDGTGVGVDGDGNGIGGGGEGGGDAAGAAGQTATLFINDSANGIVYRYNVTPSSDLVLTATISAPPAAWVASISLVMGMKSLGGLRRFRGSAPDCIDVQQAVQSGNRR